MNWRKRLTLWSNVAVWVLTAALLIINPVQAGQGTFPGPPDHANASVNAAQNNQNTVVKTEYGKLRGYVSEGRVLVWKGVPYAKPPVGELRWMAPQDPQPWNGIRDAILPAEECTQLKTGRDWIREPIPVGCEDCLYLDIYRPQRPAYQRERLPVYVWIHGGSNNFGSAKLYDGTALAARSNVVAVMVQYRLGPMGWFFQPALQTNGDPLSNSGNFGTLDHAQALKWIQENIAAFGGDPDNVTITGESAGAHNVMNMVVSTLGKGLFHRAMSESGGMTTKAPVYGVWLTNRHIDALLVFDGTATDLAEAAVIRASMSNNEIAAYLRGKPAGDFFLAYLIAYGSLPTYDGIEDGTVLPVGGWIPAIQSKNYNQVPIILGSNEYETKAFMPLYGPFIKGYSVLFPGGPVPSSSYTWFQLIDVLKGNLTLEDVLPTPLDMELYEDTGYFGSRNWRTKFVDSLARELAAVQEGVYAYLFKWGGIGSGPYPFNFIYGAGHAMEIPFFFGGEDDIFGYSFLPANEAGRKDLQAAMMAYLARFARTGNPNEFGSGLPSWHEWSNVVGGPKVIVFDADLDEALIAMDYEEVKFADVTADLETAIAGFPNSHQEVARFFQWQVPW